MAAGEREWDERPIAAPAHDEKPATQGLGCGLWALIILAIPAAFAVIALGAWGLWSLFG